MKIVSEVKVPMSLIFAKELLPTAKLVMIALIWKAATVELESKKRVSNSSLAKELGLDRDTVGKAVTSLRMLGWHSIESAVGFGKGFNEYIKVPVDLILSHSLTTFAKLLYCQCLTKPIKALLHGAKYMTLSKALSQDVKTVRKSTKLLAEAGWLTMKRVNQLAPISFAITNPILTKFEDMLEKCKNRLRNSNWQGEAITREILNLIVDSTKYIDNAAPGHLENPETGCLLQYDRYYWAAGVAIEFNGTQHDYPTELFDGESVLKQRKRDEVKRKISDENSIELIVIYPHDLSVANIIQKVKNMLPMRCLRYGEELINFLDKRCAQYRRNTPVLQG